MLDKTFNVAKNPIYDGYQRKLASMLYNFFDRKTSCGAAMLGQLETLATRNKSVIKREIISNKVLAEELQKPIRRKFNKRKVFLPFIDNIFGANIYSFS